MNTENNNQTLRRTQSIWYRRCGFVVPRLVGALLPLFGLSAVTAQVIKAEKNALVAPVPPELLTEQELVQQLISLHLVQTEEEQADHLARNMNIVLGDVRRVTGLPKERLHLLSIAAKGAVDRQMESWRTSQENQIRQQAMGTTVAQVRQRLEGIGNINFGIANGNNAPEDSRLWQDTVTNTLTPEERQKWTAAAAERDKYRQEAITRLLVAEMDRQLDLTLTQCEKIEPAAAKLIHDYLPDMNSYLERGNGIDFRLLMTAFTGVPEPERQTLLTPEQTNKWLQLSADYRSWWQNIEQSHMQRMNSVPQPNGNRVAQPVIINGGAIIIRGGGGIRVLPNPNPGGNNRKK